MTRQIARDGSKVFIDQTVPAHPGAEAMHVRMIYDLDRHANYTWDLVHANVPCDKPASFQGDWGDPFATSAEIRSQVAQGAKQIGTETISGIAVNVLEASTPQMKAKVWVEPKYGLVMRIDMGMGNAPLENKYEVKSISFGRPDASVFVLPAACAGALTTALPKTESQVKAEVTGGNPDNYLDNNGDIPDAAASQKSCAVLFKVVREGTLEPVRTGFTVKMKTGDATRDLTGQLRDGAVRIPDAPKDFYLYLDMTGGAESVSLIHRECFRPETVLLAAVNTENTQPGAAPKAVHWLWVK